MVNVSLLLPFMTEEAYPSSNTSRFIEYYEGFLLAVDSMRNQGCSINLSVFDTGNGTEKINDILKNPAVKEADLLIGAVQNEQIHPLAKFAEKEQNKVCNSIHLQKRRCAIQSLCVSGKHPLNPICIRKLHRLDASCLRITTSLF
ncbi:MAG: hypothetical protein LRY33_02690 [Parabacteroides chartae]|nr:hypothetical protein [Parabacteroides chartae]